MVFDVVKLGTGIQFDIRVNLILQLVIGVKILPLPINLKFKFKFKIFKSHSNKVNG